MHRTGGQDTTQAAPQHAGRALSPPPSISAAPAAGLAPVRVVARTAARTVSVAAFSPGTGAGAAALTSAAAPRSLQLQLHLQCRRRRTCVHLRCGRIFAEVQPQPGHVHLLDALRLLARRQCGRCRQGVRLRHLLTCHTRGRRRTTMRATGSGSLSRLLAPRGALAACAHRRSRRAQYRSDHIHGARLRLSRHAAPRPAPRPPPPGTGRIRGPRARRPRPATLRRLPHGGLCRALCMWRADTCHFNCMDNTEPQP